MSACKRFLEIRSARRDPHASECQLAVALRIGAPRVKLAGPFFGKALNVDGCAARTTEAGAATLVGRDALDSCRTFILLVIRHNISSFGTGKTGFSIVRGGWFVKSHP
jgi:hypothetical protein